jgi:hypothetical protein
MPKLFTRLLAKIQTIPSWTKLARRQKLLVIALHIVLVVGLVVPLAPIQSRAFPQTLGASTTSSAIWQVRAIDTMKYSRDAARNPAMITQIPSLVAQVASLHPTHIAIDTPYDAEFVPYLAAWVQAARANNLHVWFRGNFSGWEGWFGYAKFTDPAIHHTLTRQFIVAHPSLFQAGDIFTPAPEPENGGYGDPRLSDAIRQQFLTFLTTSYVNCTNAMAEISAQGVSCGYVSMNGDVARDSLTSEVVAQTGGLVVIDHYVADPVTLKNDILSLAQKYNAKVVVGEFGAPIPDIHGAMTESQQAAYIAQDLDQMKSVSQVMLGVNYWTAFDASTALFNPDQSSRQVAQVLSAYYAPIAIEGVVTDTAGKPAVNIPVSLNNNQPPVYTNAQGAYHVIIPAPSQKVAPTSTPSRQTTSQSPTALPQITSPSMTLMIGDIKHTPGLGAIMIPLTLPRQGVIHQDVALARRNQPFWQQVTTQIETWTYWANSWWRVRWSRHD